MPPIKFHDAAGVPIQFLEVDGVLYPYPEGAQDDSIRVKRDIPGRDDDVLLVSYSKAGSHWIWEVTTMLYQGQAETIPRIKQTAMIEAMPPDVLASLPSPRILNTHFHFRNLPHDMIQRKVKIVLLHRNPKDTAVSLYNHHRDLVKFYNYNGEWKDWLPLFMQGKVETNSWFDYVLDWERVMEDNPDYPIHVMFFEDMKEVTIVKRYVLLVLSVETNSWFDYVLDWERVMEDNPDYPIHVMFFEDMKENSVQEIERLTKFLGLQTSVNLSKDIARKCSFENMKNDKKIFESDVWRTAWRKNEPQFYRKGEVGDWKNWFTVAQNEEFDQLYMDRMKYSKINVRFEI